MFAILLLPKVTRGFSTSIVRSRAMTTRAPSQLQSSRASILGSGDLSEEFGLFEKYDMVQLPDIMVDTTIWIGNLDEFVDDGDLAELILKESNSSLKYSVPCAVARRPNNDSLGYGFVHFPTIRDAEAALKKFDGFELDGRPMRVERFKDSRYARAKVPEKLVAYVLGSNKKLQNGCQNNLRRISKDDVERLSRGQPSKNKGYGSRRVPHRLNEEERKAFSRASKYGFLSLDGTGWRRGRKGSPLANSHRQWCDARGKPQIILCKATGGRMLDNIVIDLSPLRFGPLETSGIDLLYSWKADILIAAEKAGMVLNDDIEEDNTFTLDIDNYDDSIDTSIVLEVDENAWAFDPIWKLPAVSLGVFEGQRSDAKAMAKELAKLWNIPEELSDSDAGMNYGKRKGAKNRRNAGARGGGKTKMKGLSKHRRQKRVNFDDFI